MKLFMFNAKQAKAQADYALTMLIEELVSPIIQKIKSAADAGRYSIEVPRDELNDKIIRFLKKLGYKIEIGYYNSPHDFARHFVYYIIWGGE